MIFPDVLCLINPLLINRLWKNRFSWEIVGNYVFKISEREIEKIAMGIGLPCIAFKGINVLLSVKQDLNEVPLNEKLLKKLYFKIFFLNLLSKLRLTPYNTLISIIFKEMPSIEMKRNFKKEGFVFIDLPKNPYLDK